MMVCGFEIVVASVSDRENLTVEISKDGGLIAVLENEPGRNVEINFYFDATHEGRSFDWDEFLQVVLIARERLFSDDIESILRKTRAFQARQLNGSKLFLLILAAFKELGLDPYSGLLEGNYPVEIVGMVGLLVHHLDDRSASVPSGIISEIVDEVEHAAFPIPSVLLNVLLEIVARQKLGL